MTTSWNNHRPTTLVAIAAAGLVCALLPVTPGNAQTIPKPEDHRAVSGRTVPTDGHQTNGHHTYGQPVERPCFIEPFNWNDAIDGTLPRCYTNVP